MYFTDSFIVQIKTKDIYKGFAKILMKGLILETISYKDCYQK